MGEGQGVKDDGEKLEYHLIPAVPEELVVRALMFGKKKYGEDNWKRVPNARVRYWDAARRHLGKMLQGEELDQESDLPHAAHAICCLLFLLDPVTQPPAKLPTNADVIKTIDQVAETYWTAKPQLPNMDYSTGCPYCPHPLTKHGGEGCEDVVGGEFCPCAYRQKEV